MNQKVSEISDSAGQNIFRYQTFIQINFRWKYYKPKYSDSFHMFIQLLILYTRTCGKNCNIFRSLSSYSMIFSICYSDAITGIVEQCLMKNLTGLLEVRMLATEMSVQHTIQYTWHCPLFLTSSHVTNLLGIIHLHILLKILKAALRTML